MPICIHAHWHLLFLADFAIQFINAWNTSASAVLKKAFDGFDHEKKGAINCDVVATILRMMGQAYNAQTLKELIDEVDADGGSRAHTTPFTPAEFSFLQ